MKVDELEKIEKYFNGTASKEESNWVESLFQNGENNHDLKSTMEESWKSTSDTSIYSDRDIDIFLNEIHFKIGDEVIKRQKPYEKIKQFYTKAAAILLLPIIAGSGLLFLYLNHHNNKYENVPIKEQKTVSTIIAPMGARIAFKLPDNTTGMLNSGSTLSYSLPFTNNREISLEGEAWFDVTHDSEHPFQIEAGNTKVRVLGTNFNLSAYPADNYVEVVLQQGKVDFVSDKSDKIVSVLPSERLIFQDGIINKTTTDPAKYKAWTEGKLIFKNDPMAEVARRIERWYNVKIILENKELEKYSFRGTFEDDELEDVLRFLSLTSPIKYRISPRVLLPDGTYEKEIVTICLKNNK